VIRLRCARSGRLTLIVAWVVVLVASAACSAVTTPFQKATSNAASTFAAAAQTLTLLHEQKLSEGYAQGSFDATDGLAEQLPGLKGAPAAAESAHLAALTKRANDAVDEPCIGEGCDWEAQVKALKSASDALDKASKAQ